MFYSQKNDCYRDNFCCQKNDCCRENNYCRIPHCYCPTGPQGPIGPTGPTGPTRILAFGGLLGDNLPSVVVPAGSVITEIPLNLQMENQNVTYSGSAIQIVEPGIYQIQANLGFTSLDEAFGASFSIALNGVEIPITYTNLIVDTTRNEYIVNIFYELSAGNLITLVVNSVTGGTIVFDIAANGSLTVNKVN